METCANYTTKDCMFFSSDERRWIHKVRVLAEKYPDEVTIIRQPENNDGCIYARMPVRYLKLIRPTQRELTDEEKIELSERLNKARMPRTPI